ncbi:hypothetical protein R1sor_009119 [Riccia sorocarpa]|uniref:Uncharacterized protein n=1 Tax=Riccia sorocarpa TaxID=122646 RepID=A0ABD3H851_9MARC
MYEESRKCGYIPESMTLSEFRPREWIRAKRAGQELAPGSSRSREYIPEAPGVRIDPPSIPPELASKILKEKNDGKPPSGRGKGRRDRGRGRPLDVGCPPEATEEDDDDLATIWKYAEKCFEDEKKKKEEAASRQIDDAKEASGADKPKKTISISQPEGLECRPSLPSTHASISTQASTSRQASTSSQASTSDMPTPVDKAWMNLCNLTLLTDSLTKVTEVMVESHNAKPPPESHWWPPIVTSPPRGRPYNRYPFPGDRTDEQIKKFEEYGERVIAEKREWRLDTRAQARLGTLQTTEEIQKVKNAYKNGWRRRRIGEEPCCAHEVQWDHCPEFRWQNRPQMDEWSDQDCIERGDFLECMARDKTEIKQ